MNKGNNNKGFTLIEVIVAAMILAVAIIPLLSSFVVSTRLNVKGRQKEQAMTVAENTMEGIKACGVNNAYKIATGTLSGVSILPSVSVKGTMLSYKPEKQTVGPYDLSGYVLANGTTTLGSSYSSVSIDTQDYELIIPKVEMGSAFYDVYVIMKQDVEDVESRVALAIEKQTDNFSNAKMNVLLYYNVDVYVKLHEDAGESVTFAELGSYIKNNYLAKYSGSVITQS